jgi:hypothetical protein
LFHYMSMLPLRGFGNFLCERSCAMNLGDCALGFYSCSTLLHWPTMVALGCNGSMVEGACTSGVIQFSSEGLPSFCLWLDHSMITVNLYYLLVMHFVAELRMYLLKPTVITGCNHRDSLPTECAAPLQATYRAIRHSPRIYHVLSDRAAYQVQSAIVSAV